MDKGAMRALLFSRGCRAVHAGCVDRFYAFSFREAREDQLHSCSCFVIEYAPQLL